jgi:VanZ family protein
LRLTEKARRWSLVVLTVILALIILFLVYTSEEPRWGGGYWESWLISRFQVPVLMAHNLVFWIRKSLHFLGYGSLGLLLWLYWFLWGFKKAYWLGIGAVGLIASLDEYFQSFTSFRTGKPEDMLLDICGAIVFTGLFNFYFKRRDEH